MSDVARRRDEAGKHMEFILGIVTRLANNSFHMKGWALTTAGAVFTFAAQQKTWGVATIGFLPILAFFGLDAYYLRQERLFRCLYDDVRRGNVEPFLMDHRPYVANDKCTWSSTLRSAPLCGFYGLLASAGIIIICALYIADDANTETPRSVAPTPDGASRTPHPVPQPSAPSAAATDPPSRPPASAEPGAGASGEPTVSPPSRTN